MFKQPSGINSANVTVVSVVERSFSMSMDNEELHRAFDLLLEASPTWRLVAGKLGLKRVLQHPQR